MMSGNHKRPRQTPCRDCGAPIIWMLTHNGKNIPIDVDSVDEANLDYEGDKPLYQYAHHTVHFETCEVAARRRYR